MPVSVVAPGNINGLAERRTDPFFTYYRVSILAHITSVHLAANTEIMSHKHPKYLALHLCPYSSVTLSDEDCVRGIEALVNDLVS